MKRFISIFFAHKVLFARKKFFVFMRHEELCHCEKRSDVAISRKGYLVINPRKILLYLRGEKGINKQKTNNCRLRRLFGQKCSLFRAVRSLLFFGKVYERLAFSFCNVQRLRRAAEIVVDKKHDIIRFFHNVFIAF